MSALLRLAPPPWLRLPARTARLRLTLLYSALFLALGTGLVMFTFLLARGTSTIHVTQVATAVPRPVGTAPVGAGPAAVIGAPAPREVISQLRHGVVAQRNADLGQLLAVSWVLLALTTLGSAMLGWVAAGRVLRPLRSITATARTISAGNLHERLAVTGPDDEFKALGDTLDDLLGRLQASFEAQRRFVANASHELRTPLTVERALLQVALADPEATTQSLRSTCEELLASQVEHEQLLEALLTLATSESGVERREPLDLSVLTREVLATPRPEIERRGIRIETVLHPTPTPGDPVLIARLIANLLDNAIEYNVPNGSVTVETAINAGRATVTVSNTGPLIERERVGQLFEPFQRLNGRRESDAHHGLGLSIVQAIATAHGAEIGADAEPGGGLCVAVRFPG